MLKYFSEKLYLNVSAVQQRLLPLWCFRIKFTDSRSGVLGYLVSIFGPAVLSERSVFNVLKLHGSFPSAAFSSSAVPLFVLLH